MKWPGLEKKNKALQFAANRLSVQRPPRWSGVVQGAALAGVEVVIGRWSKRPDLAWSLLAGTLYRQRRRNCRNDE